MVNEQLQPNHNGANDPNSQLRIKLRIPAPPSRREGGKRASFGDSDVVDGRPDEKHQGRGRPDPSGQEQKPLKFVFVEFENRKRAQDELDDASDERVPPPPPKKTRRNASKKKVQPKKEEAVKGPRTFTVHLLVWSTETSSEPRRPGKTAKTTTTSESKGPFMFDTSCSLATFRREVANALRCPEALLPVSEFEWKFEEAPRAGLRKRIADEAGFEALVDAVESRRRADNVVVWLHLPKPVKDEEDWDLDAELSDHAEHPFDFDVEHDAVDTKEPIAEMAAPIEGQLPQGFPPGAPPYHPYYPPPYTPYMSYMPPPGYIYPYAPAGPYPPPPMPMVNLPPGPPGTSTPFHKVSLAEFCAKHGLSGSDMAKLAKLEYRPGDRSVERLDAKEWRDASFNRLEWDHFLSAHHAFCASIRSYIM